jgi:hypothetical protein
MSGYTGFTPALFRFATPSLRFAAASGPAVRRRSGIGRGHSVAFAFCRLPIGAIMTA